MWPWITTADCGSLIVDHEPHNHRVLFFQHFSFDFRASDILPVIFNSKFIFLSTSKNSNIDQAQTSKPKMNKKKKSSFVINRMYRSRSSANILNPYIEKFMNINRYIRLSFNLLLITHRFEASDDFKNWKKIIFSSWKSEKLKSESRRA